MGLSAIASADVLLAPVGGQAIPLGGTMVGCADPGGGWTLLPDGRAARPPTEDAAVGHPVRVRVAARREECAAAGPALEVTLIALAHPPVVDASSVVAEIDAGRILLGGQEVAGAQVGWRAGDRAGVETCVALLPEAGAPGKVGGGGCAIAVPRGLPVQPSRIDLVVHPAGWPTGPMPGGPLRGFDATGRAESSEVPAPLHPARTVLDRLFSPDASIDVSSGLGRVPFAHLDAVATVECTDATCDAVDDALVVGEEHGADEQLEVRVRLRPGVLLRRAGALDAAPRVALPLSRCPVTLMSAPPLRRVGEQRVVIRVAGRCASDAGTAFSIDGAAGRVERVERRAAEQWAVVRLPAAPESDELTFVARHGATIVGTARVRTRLPPTAQVVLELPGRGVIDFVPVNREARARLPVLEGAELVLAPVDGAYRVRRDPQDGALLLRGVEGAAGSVALHLAVRDRTLPAELGAIDLASWSEPVQRALRTAHLPVPLDGGHGGPPFVELVCGDEGAPTRAIAPGTPATLPFGARDTCRVLLHRERLTDEDGVQWLQLSVQVSGADGTPRSEASVDRRLVLRRAAEPLVVYLHGVAAPFDRLLVRLGHAADETHYALALDERGDSGALQYTVTAGTDRFRLYATTALPTGLFRVADAGHSGILTLNAGALLRVTLLSRDGHEFPVGAEAGVMWLGIAGDTSAAASPHGQVALVAGVGVGVPIANAGRATQTSISLHAWLEYEVSRAFDSGTGSPLGFVFGPSITVGDLGLSF